MAAAEREGKEAGTNRRRPRIAKPKTLIECDLVTMLWGALKVLITFFFRSIQNVKDWIICPSLQKKKKKRSRSGVEESDTNKVCSRTLILYYYTRSESSNQLSPKRIADV